MIHTRYVPEWDSVIKICTTKPIPTTPCPICGRQETRNEKGELMPIVHDYMLHFGIPNP
jgi:hypothetical protein